jgi:Serine/threonine protein kinase
MSDERYDDLLDEQQGSEEDPSALFAGTKKVAVNAPVAVTAATGNGPQTGRNFDDEDIAQAIPDDLGVADEEFSESEAYTSGAQEIIKPHPEAAENAEDDGMSLFHSFLEETDAQSPQPAQAVAQQQYEETYAQDAAGENYVMVGEYAEQAYAAEGTEGEYPEQAYAEGEYAQQEYAGYVEGEYSGQAYAEGEYAQQEYAEGAEGEYAEQGAEGEYTPQAYAEGEYANAEAAEGEPYAEAAEGEYAEQAYADGEYAAETETTQEPDYSQPVAPTYTEHEPAKQFAPGESGEFAAFVLEEHARLREDSTEIEPVESSTADAAQAVSGLQQALSGAQQALSGRQQSLSGWQSNSGSQQTVSGSQPPASAARASDPNIPLVQQSGVYPELTEEQLASPIEVASIVGETLCDDYRVLGEHGEGDLTQVYVGREIASGRLVAIKRLKVPTPKAVERFSLAIKNLGKLNHPSIVQSIAYLESPSGEPFYVMECVEDGISLEELLQDAGMIEEEDVIASILIQIADAVDFAHQASVVHGGLKPTNIMVMQGDEDLIVKILDFGMERLRVANRALASSYFAPEQITQGTVSSKSDIYSLGVLAYHMLTGHLPYDGSVDSIAELKQGHKPEDWQPLYAVRPELACVQELSQLLDEAMEVDPQWRMSSMAEFSRALKTGLNRFRNSTSTMKTAVLKNFPRSIRFCNSQSCRRLPRRWRLYLRLPETMVILPVDEIGRPRHLKFQLKKIRSRCSGKIACRRSRHRPPVRRLPSSIKSFTLMRSTMTSFKQPRWLMKKSACESSSLQVLPI